MKQRRLLAQSAPVDGAALLAQAQLPRCQDRRWKVELALLSRMNAWSVTPLKTSYEVSVLEFTFAEENGAALLRAPYLFVGDAV